MKVGHALGVAGHAIWHLGGEDPSIWNAIGDGRLAAQRRQPARHPAGLRRGVRGHGRDPSDHSTSPPTAIATSPSTRRRATSRRRRSSRCRFRTSSRARAGRTRNRHRVALTFDDGPDGRWTPMILDTLRSRGVKATFFVVGQNVDTDQRLLAAHVRRRARDRESHLPSSRISRSRAARAPCSRST